MTDTTKARDHYSHEFRACMFDELVAALETTRHQLWTMRRTFTEHDHNAMNQAGAVLAKCREVK